MTKASDLPLSDWNWGVLMLTQALIGAVSPNFRLVELAFVDGNWVVRVTLSEESASDREAIEDICDDMGGFLMDLQGCITSSAEARVVAAVTVSTEAIVIDPASEARMVFRMRET